MLIVGAVTIAAATAAVLSLASSESSASDEARRGATVASEVAGLPLPAPSHECAVCLSELPAGAEPAAVRALPACGHAFHADCIGRWLQLRPECPLCRHPVPLAGAAGGGQQATTIACGFGDGRVVWTRSPSTSARQ